MSLENSHDRCIREKNERRLFLGLLWYFGVPTEMIFDGLCIYEGWSGVVVFSRTFRTMDFVRCPWIVETKIGSIGTSWLVGLNLREKFGNWALMVVEVRFAWKLLHEFGKVLSFIPEEMRTDSLAKLGAEVGWWYWRRAGGGGLGARFINLIGYECSIITLLNFTSQLYG